MSHWSLRSPVTPEARRDEQDDNPQVSSISRFCDDVWDFSDENRNPAMGRADKRICWSFTLPGGGLFTDARFRSLLTASKQFSTPCVGARSTRPAIPRPACGIYSDR